MPIRNCDFWSSPGEANVMYAKYLSLLESNDQKPTVVEWLYKWCDFALQLKLDDVIQYRYGRDEPQDVRYARVVNINRDRASGEKFVTFRTVGICFPGSSGAYQASPDHRIHDRHTRTLEPYHIKWPEIPEDLLALMLPQACKCGLDLAMEPLKEKCPFKDEYKEPVPPCMKEEDDD